MRNRGRRRLFAANCNPGQLRDADSGQCGPGIGVDIPRAEMPQIPAARLGALREFLAAEGVVVTDGWQPAGDLRPTQVEFRQGRVESISDGVALFQPVITSADDYVLDGTHRWIKAWQRGAGTPVPVTTVGLPLREALAKLKEFPGVVYAENAAANQSRDQHGRFVTSGGEPLNEHELTALDSAKRAAESFGIPVKETHFHRLDGERTYGEHGADKAHLVNVHAGNLINKQLNFKPDRPITEGEHLAAHEVVHQAYSADQDAGKAAMDKLKEVKAEFGNAVSMYGAFNGAHENLMELGAAYVHSPESLKRYSPEMYAIAHEWAGKLKSSRVSNSVTINPFVSESQRRWMHANHPAMAAKWEAHTPKGKQLPRKKSVSNQRLFRRAKHRAAAGLPPGSHVANSRKLLRRDPTRTFTLRRTFLTYLRRRFDLLKGKVYSLVVGENAFGLTANRFQFHSSPEKLEEFQKWLKSQFKSDVAGQTDEQLWRQYITQGFSKGAGRAFDDTRKPYANGYAKDKSTADVYRGGKAEFLRSSFGRPETREKVELLASRAFDELEDVTAEMGNKMSRVLADALVEGKSPRDAARDMTKVIDMSYARAEKIARTELIRAHAEGQLNSFDALGVAELGVEVEFTAADGACPECTDLDGQVFSIDDAHSMIPVHPDCRCCFRPAGPAVTGNRRGVRPISNERRGGTFFAECPRDERGHCLPATGVVVATPAELDHARRVAVVKALAVPQPTAADVETARKGIAKVGVNLYRMGIKGNTADRRRRREALLKEFGDGHHCPCVYCGLKLGEGTLEQDKIITTAQGGRYKKANLVPACGTCNKQRGDLPWSSIKFS